MPEVRSNTYPSGFKTLYHPILLRITFPDLHATGTGEDDPDTSKNDIMTQGAKWVQAAGGVVVSEGEETGVEVSPLISYVSQPSRHPFKCSRANINSGW